LIAGASPEEAHWVAERDAHRAAEGRDRRDLLQDLTRAVADDPLVQEDGLSITGTSQGYVRVAFRLAFWYLLHAKDFASALIDVVNRGGDADTNGAIVGALLGARFGESGIPPEWRFSVLSCSPPSPWGDVYHPRNLLALARE
jgi:ADP-ribosylglycohydrolase